MATENQFLAAQLASLTDLEIEWLFENAELKAIESNPQLAKRTIQIDGRVISNKSGARHGILGLLNHNRQVERQTTFQKRVESGQDNGKIRIVSEGDSWFNYPTKLKEVIDHLFDEFSMFCCSYGGDWLANIYAEEEYLKALRKYKPDVFLLSGGGNDLVGGMRMLTILRDYKSGMRGVDLIIHDEFESILEDFRTIYRAIFKKVFNEFPDMKIICHGYDYPYFEGKDKVWFGIPFHSKGIDNIDIQNEIGHFLIDKFYDMMQSVIVDFPNVHYIDNRGLVKPRNKELWLNELHPTEEGFKMVADVFSKKIHEVVGR